MFNKVIVVGVGGVGSNLASPLGRLLSYVKKEGEEPYHLLFIDGDKVEIGNLKRQDFVEKEIDLPKAEAIIGAIKAEGVIVDFEPVYINEENVGKFITEGSIVIMGVDNDMTKHIIQNHCLSLPNIALISGGNETYDGDVSVYFKVDGFEVTPPIWHDQPDIKNPPTNDHPSNVRCGARYNEDPQLFATNFTVAANILDVLTPILTNGEPLVERLYFDIRTGNRAITWTKDYVDVATYLLKK